MQNPLLTVVYSHGRFGSPWYGFKIEALREVALKAGANMISVRYPEDMAVEDMERKLYAVVADDVNVPGDVVFLGSSRGGYLSTRVAGSLKEFFREEPVRMDDDKVLPPRHVLGQFLVAPAFYIKPEYYPDQDPSPPPEMRTTIVHGLNDDIISCENSVKFARQFGAQLYLIAGGHRLNSQRERLCVLFEDFLRDCVRESAGYFAEWKKVQPQEVAIADDVSPRAGR